MDINCFLIVPNGVTHRYASICTHDPSCTASHIAHIAEIRLSDGLLADNETSGIRISTPPAKCECGYSFTESDTCELDVRTVYVRADNGAFVCDSIHSSPSTSPKLTSGAPYRTGPPPGAMWFDDTLEGNPRFCGPDGKCLCVMTPAGLCHVDMWQVDRQPRHGVAPDITADRPIGSNGNWAGIQYNGFLRNGVLIEICDAGQENIPHELTTSP